MTQQPTEPAIDYIDAGDGTYLPPDEVAAAYTLPSDVWTDIPEARPRARARSTEGHTVTITVDKDGTMHWPDDQAVIVDRYEGDEYAAVRAEGEARWAAIDAARAGR